MKLQRKVTDIFDRAINLLALLACTFIIFIVLAVNSEVAVRYFLGLNTLWWVIEVSGYSLLFITFLGTTWVLKREGHVKMDLVISRLNPRTQALVNIITSALGAIICLLIVRYSIQSTWHHFQIGYWIPSQLEPPKWIILGIIPIGFFLLFIQFLRRAYGYLGKWKALTG